jgi:hypothetical protein
MTETELRSFFNDYATSFLQTEVEVAQFYHAPCITARQGALRLNATRQDTQAFFAEVLRRYREQGSSQGDIRSFSWLGLGANSIAATVAWAYKDVAGRVLWESTFTYNLFKNSEGWKILLQTQHDAA